MCRASYEGEGIQGRLVVPGTTQRFHALSDAPRLTGAVRFRDFRLLLQLHAGEEHRFAYCRNDGTFTLPPLPPGVHVLTISGKGEWNFPPLKIDVSSRAADSIRVASLDTWKAFITSFLTHICSHFIHSSLFVCLLSSKAHR